MKASNLGRTAIVKELLSRGADVTLQAKVRINKVLALINIRLEICKCA